jgi:hypothetical protein
MNNRITLTGTINFEPSDKTKKHLSQASWKKIAMVLIDGDITDYYAWFIKKRYNLMLNKPLRGAHISFINDSMRDLTQNGKISETETLNTWEEVKKKWNGKKINIVLDLDPRTDGRTWWLNIPHDERGGLQAIRDELGLGRPYFGMHMSVGYARPGIMEEHSTYIHESIKKGFIPL